MSGHDKTDEKRNHNDLPFELEEGARVVDWDDGRVPEATSGKET